MSSLYIISVDSDTTIEYGYDTYLVDATNNNITLTLPDVSGGADGTNFIISRIDNSSNTVTITPVSSSQINGQSSASLGGQQNTRLAVLDTHWHTVQGVHVL